MSEANCTESISYGAIRKLIAPYELCFLFCFFVAAIFADYRAARKLALTFN
jgi:hypothetical protein